LTSADGILDDGRGLMRSKVFNYDHEKENGRTSSISHEVMGFDKTGKQIDPLVSGKKKN
jgi:GTPase